MQKKKVRFTTFPVGCMPFGYVTMANEKYSIVITSNGMTEIPICFKKDQDYSVCGDFHIEFPYSLENLQSYTSGYRSKLLEIAGFVLQKKDEKSEWFYEITDKRILHSICDVRSFATEVTKINMSLPENLEIITDNEWSDIEMIAELIIQSK